VIELDPFPPLPFKEEVRSLSPKESFFWFVFPFPPSVPRRRHLDFPPPSYSQVKAFRPLFPLFPSFPQSSSRSESFPVGQQPKTPSSSPFFFSSTLHAAEAVEDSFLFSLRTESSFFLFLSSVEMLPWRTVLRRFPVAKLDSLF